MRRLDAERYRLSLLVVLAVTLASGGGSCAKTWVLSSGIAAGGAGGGSALGGGGSSGSSGSFGQGGHGGSGSGGHGCACTTTRLHYDIPNSDMVFVVGRNSSMSTKFGDIGSRMTAVQTALHNVTTANENAVNFGFQDFPSLNGCSNGSTCCPSTDMVAYPIPGNAGTIDQAFRTCGPAQSSTPGCVASNDSRSVAQALSSAGDLFTAQRDIPNDRYVVLITDDAPGCVTDDPQQACSSALKVVSSWAHSFKTYVIGIGYAAQDQQCLQSIALMGQTSTNLFDVADPPALTKAINQIVGIAASAACTVELLSSPGDPTLVSVFLQGREICYDPTGRSGWNYAYGSSMRIEINGGDCAAVQAAQSPVDLAILAGCPSCNTSFSCP